jgi:hypothetical protein
MKRLPIKAAKDLGQKFGLSRVLVIAVDEKEDLTHTVSWGDTKQNCGLAAMDIQKLRAVLEAQPTSLAEAVATAKRVRPKDVEGF